MDSRSVGGPGVFSTPPSVIQDILRKDMNHDETVVARLSQGRLGFLLLEGGALGFWVLCRLHYAPRITVPRSLRWAACGAVSVSSTSALLVCLFSPECEPQNIAAYDKGK
ncbi:hypothetical protein V6N13_138319 [Hibiscus sabdariffa]